MKHIHSIEKKVKVKMVSLNDNPLSANPEKWSNTLKQTVGNLPTICLNVFDHFMNLSLKGIECKEIFASNPTYLSCFN